MKRELMAIFMSLAVLGVGFALLPMNCSCSDSNGGAEQCPAGQIRLNGKCVTPGDGEVDVDVDPDPNADRDRSDRDDAADDDQDIVSQCVKDDDCAPGYWCGAMQQCTQDCAADTACQQGQFCNAYGRCAALRESDTDGEQQACPGSRNDECPTGFVCNSESVCVEGCASRADCRIGNDCNAGLCRLAVTDGDQLRCTKDQDCDQGQKCVGNLCITQSDVEVPDLAESDEENTGTPCTTDEQCFPGRYCGEDNFCRFDCLGNVPCANNGDCEQGQNCMNNVCNDCPQGRICIAEKGKCVIPGGDVDDAVEQIGCTTDTDCIAGTYCNEQHVCAHDCTRDQDCTDGKVCGPRGKCETPTDEEDAEPEGPQTCTEDAECPMGYYCLVATQTCVRDCVSDQNCGEGYVCDDRGRCKPAGGDEEGPQCMQDADCPSKQYCDGDRQCKQGCLTNESCGNGLVCNEHGRCVSSDAEVSNDSDIIVCTTDAECPADQHCLGTMICGRVCGTDIGNCQQGYECDVRGRCQPVQSDPDPDYDVPPGYCGPLPPIVKTCTVDANCWIIISSNFCECQAAGVGETRQNYPRYVMQGDQCVQDTSTCGDPGCAGMRPKCIDNGCVLLPPGDEDYGEGHCEADIDCPSGHYCDQQLNICKQDCVTNEDCNDPNKYCNDIGKCLPIDNGKK